jgi:hypothetical protein
VPLRGPSSAGRGKPRCHSGSKGQRDRTIRFMIGSCNTHPPGSSPD